MNTVLSPEVIGVFVFSGDFHGQLFTPPADRADGHLGELGLDVILADRNWRDFQKGVYIVAGTAGWRWSLWESHRLFNYLTQHQAPGLTLPYRLP